MNTHHKFINRVNSKSVVVTDTGKAEIEQNATLKKLLRYMGKCNATGDLQSEVAQEKETPKKPEVKKEDPKPNPPKEEEILDILGDEKGVREKQTDVLDVLKSENFEESEDNDYDFITNDEDE